MYAYPPPPLNNTHTHTHTNRMLNGCIKIYSNYFQVANGFDIAPETSSQEHNDYDTLQVSCSADVNELSDVPIQSPSLTAESPVPQIMNMLLWSATGQSINE